MASQPAISGSLAVTEMTSFIRGYHEYKEIWQPVIGESLILKTEPTNVKDRLAVSVQKDGQVVGHVPRNIAPLFYYFLDRDVNKGFAEVTAKPLNRGAGMGMEVPCVFRLYGPEPYVQRLNDMIKRDLDSVKLRETHEI